MWIQDGIKGTEGLFYDTEASFCNLMSLVSFQLKNPNFKFLTSELIISVIPKLLFYMQDTHETEAQSLAGNATLFSTKIVHFTRITFTLYIDRNIYYIVKYMVLKSEIYGP